MGWENVEKRMECKANGDTRLGRLRYAAGRSRTVAQVSEPAVSPISKSAARRKFERVEPADGTRVLKPARQPTWKPALRQM
jgi:hypothetical protein